MGRRARAQGQVNFNSSDFGSEAPPPPAAPQKPRSQRSRALLGTTVAAVIAFILIAIVLAIISALGERRLALVQSPSMASVAGSRSTRATPGLLAPSPLPIHRVPPPSSGSPEGPGGGRAPVAAPLAGIGPAAPQAVAVPAPVVVPLPPTARQIQQILSALSFTRIHDAFLFKPYADPNPKQLQRPIATDRLADLRQASRISPQAVRTIVEQRRPLETLAQLHSQAAMNRAPAATTRPSS